MKKHISTDLLLHHWQRLLGLLHRTTSTATSWALALLALLDHWNKEMGHRSSSRPHSRNKLLLVTKSSLRNYITNVFNKIFATVKNNRQ
jgi:hypothetical protein